MQASIFGFLANIRPIQLSAGTLARARPMIRDIAPMIRSRRMSAWPGRLRAPHDLNGAAAVCRRQHDLGPPDELARSVAVGQKSLKLSTVGGAKAKADVIASHAPSTAYQTDLGNLMSGGEQ